MKRTVIAIILIVVSLVVAVYVNIKLVTDCDSLFEKFSLVRDLTDNDFTENKKTSDKEKIEKAVNAAVAEFEDKETLLHIAIYHSLMHELDEGVKKMNYYAETEDYKMLNEVAVNCIAEVRHIKESALPTCDNILSKSIEKFTYPDV